MKKVNDKNANTTVWACWQKPQASFPPTDYLLSFLSPSDELACEPICPSRIISARKIFQTVMDEARKIYIDIVARIGTVLYDEKRTFRQALAKPGWASQWWFHPVSAKNCEYDPTFYFILSILTVNFVMHEYGLQRLVLVGATPDLAHAFRKTYSVKEMQPRRRSSNIPLILKTLASRLANALFELRNILVSRRTVSQQEKSFEIVFSSFWDWSVYFDKRSNALKDCYFECLPDELKSLGVSSVGWFAWLDIGQRLGKKGKRYRDRLKPLKSCKDIIILQRFLTPWILFKNTLDFFPLWRYLQIKNRPDFRIVFQKSGTDYFPLFRNQLLKGFMGWFIPHCNLVASATVKACEVYTPRLCITFLEHYLHSRSIYSSVKRGNENIQCYTTQHASYNQNKTFLFFDPTIEFRGIPDGCAVPHPDKVFAMGSLGYDLFLKCGYSKEDVYLTGSPRYDSISCRAKFSRSFPKSKEKLKVLMVCSLDISIEMDMIEAAYLAAKGVKCIQLLIRIHPSKKICDYTGFGRFGDRIEVTRGSLHEDLERSDLILYTFTTVAEEAYLCGKPVWQWLPLGYNGSALSSVTKITQFNSVSDLKRAFQKACVNRETLSTDNVARPMVLEKLFYREDGAAAQRIAAQCLKNIRFHSS